MLLRLVKRQYDKSPLLYRIFFDKTYRPERFKCISGEIDKHRNVNEFRTYVMHNHFRFP